MLSYKRIFYVDTPGIIQVYPEVKEELKRQVDEAIQIVKNLNYLAIGRGGMKPEPPEMPGLYDRLAEQLWMNNHFRFAYMKIRELKEDMVIKGLETNYSIVYPYLTEKGKEVYEVFINSLKEQDNSQE